jgi:hypothetical protein
MKVGILYGPGIHCAASAREEGLEAHYTPLKIIIQPSPASFTRSPRATLLAT